MLEQSSAELSATMSNNKETKRMSKVLRNFCCKYTEMEDDTKIKTRNITKNRTSRLYFYLSLPLSPLHSNVQWVQIINSTQLNSTSAGQGRAGTIDPNFIHPLTLQGDYACSSMSISLSTPSIMRCTNWTSEAPMRPLFEMSNSPLGPVQPHQWKIIGIAGELSGDPQQSIGQLFN